MKHISKIGNKRLQLDLVIQNWQSRFYHLTQSTKSDESSFPPLLWNRGRTTTRITNCKDTKVFTIFKERTMLFSYLTVF